MVVTAKSIIIEVSPFLTKTLGNMCLNWLLFQIWLILWKKYFKCQWYDIFQSILCVAKCERYIAAKGQHTVLYSYLEVQLAHRCWRSRLPSWKTCNNNLW